MKKPKKRGPPPFKPTKVQRDQVVLLVADGMSEPAIATVIGICQNTLRRHFAEELEFGHARKRAQMLSRLDKAARAGNVTAMKFLTSRLDKLTQEAPEQKPEKLGKKETAEIEAQTAHKGSSWGELLN